MSILAYNIGARWRCLGIIMSRMWHHGPTRFRSERPKDLLDKLESRKDAIEIGWMGPTGQTFDKAPHFNRNISAGNEMEETNARRLREKNCEPLPHFKRFSRAHGDARMDGRWARDYGRDRTRVDRE